jgi:oxygen-independent coproporphyrinogen-3 oxidase
MQRNFQGYSTHGDCDLVGLGMSSIGHVGPSYHQNARTLQEYYAAIDDGHLPIRRGMFLSDDDLVRADVIQQLMCHGDLDMQTFEERYGVAFRAYFAAELVRLANLQKDGLIDILPRGLQVTSRGRFLLRIIAMCFDAYLGTDHGATGANPPSYSKAL